MQRIARMDVGREVINKRECVSTATFSDCNTYRYGLTRSWDETRPRALFIGLNPSTADALKVDPTIRRCVIFAMDWGFGSFEMANAFAFRATDPEVMARDLLPIGQRDEHGQECNDQWLLQAAERARLIVCAWGAHPLAEKRGRELVAMLVGRGRILTCLGLSKDGHPRHPLYLRRDTMPVVFAVPGALEDAQARLLAPVELAALIATPLAG